MKSERVHLVMPSWLKEAAQQMAESKGITLSEYIKDTLKSSLSADTLKKPIAKNEPESNAD